jgi:hypothetical protein
VVSSTYIYIYIYVCVCVCVIYKVIYRRIALRYNYFTHVGVRDQKSLQTTDKLQNFTANEVHNYNSLVRSALSVPS